MEHHFARRARRTIALVGNHVPRQCGIATFTADLNGALNALGADVDSFVVAMNDAGRHHAYPPIVRYEIPEAELAAYQRSADYLNVNDVDVVSLQHEYGIFGGEAGSYVLTLLRGLRMPVVTTLHTVLAEPSEPQRLVMDEICSLSERLVVMSAEGSELLARVHGVQPSKIDLIPHGIPNLPGAFHSKSKLGVEKKQVLLTFGLLSPDKGIEYVIDALPTITARNPDVVYIVLGATHPHVKESHGEAYRLMLEARARKIGVSENLLFHDRFVSTQELVQFLSAADIYLTPYLNAEQITSGTLAYAVGSGKTVVSTPYRYARELLADGRGVLVPSRDASAIAEEVVALLDDDARRKDIERRAAAFGRSMAWPIVARSYAESFERARVDLGGRVRAIFPTLRIARRTAVLPEVNLAHLRTMTDRTGLLQHAVYTVPRYEDGYCLDDNARALMLLAFVEEARIETPATVRALATGYLAFVRHAFDPASGRFKNFLGYSRTWLESVGSEDSHGRAIWSLGAVVGRLGDAGRRALAIDIFDAALPKVLEFTSPRAWAYSLLGIAESLRTRREDPRTRSIGATLAARLLDLFRRSNEKDWPWFEDRLTYGNARLPQAMIASGAWLRNDAMSDVGLRSLEWLVTVQRTESGFFAPIGSNGFFVRGGEKATYDQQPVEACGTISACLDAYRATGDSIWTDRARHAFDWFLGQNHLDRWLYDAGTGGCRDGLHLDRMNENQGAESTLSFLTALMELRLLDQPRELPSSGRPIERTRPSIARLA